MILEVDSPAKINLFLHVTGKRPDGFHELYSLMAALDLADRIAIDLDRQGLTVSCSHPRVPQDTTNLAWKAADLFRCRYQERAGRVPFEGAHIHIDKVIPMGGGLGGGSSNAAAVLCALNNHFGKPFSRDDLMAMGLMLGADVPFFIHGGPAYASGVGEVLTDCTDLPEFYVLLCCPGVVSATAAVFKKLEFGLTLTPNYIMNTGLNVLPSGQGPEDWDSLHNDLERPACVLYPEIRSTKEEMELLLHKKVFMSGSGSSLFALFSDLEKARKEVALLSEAWSGSKKVFLTRVRHSDR